MAERHSARATEAWGHSGRKQRVAAGAERAGRVGIGLNLAHHPELADRPATDLSAHGASIAPLNFLPSLDRSMQEWISNWASGDGFAAVREAWLARSLPPGTRLTVNAGQDIVTGVFAGLDPEGRFSSRLRPEPCRR